LIHERKKAEGLLFSPLAFEKIKALAVSSQMAERLFDKNSGEKFIE